MRTIPLTLTPEQAVVLLGLLASSRLTSEASSELRVLQQIEQELERELLALPPPSESSEFVSALLTRGNAA
jgi:hypothetical protein